MPRGTGNARTTGTTGCAHWSHGHDDTWTIWVQNTVTSATTTGSAWDHWIVSASTATATYTGMGQIVWDRWVEETNAVAGRIIRPTISNYSRPIQVTPEERARREAEQRLHDEARAAAAAAKQEANRKAELLLRACLTQQQVDDLDKRRCFFLHTGGKKYRIDRGQHGNVKLLNERDQPVASYCIQPAGGLPDADAMLAQKLLLETDPEEFQKIANVTHANGRIEYGRRTAMAVAL